MEGKYTDHGLFHSFKLPGISQALDVQTAAAFPTVLPRPRASSISPPTHWTGCAGSHQYLEAIGSPWQPDDRTWWLLRPLTSVRSPPARIPERSDSQITLTHNNKSHIGSWHTASCSMYTYLNFPRLVQTRTIQLIWTRWDRRLFR